MKGQVQGGTTSVIGTSSKMILTVLLAFFIFVVLAPMLISWISSVLHINISTNGGDSVFRACETFNGKFYTMESFLSSKSGKGDDSISQALMPYIPAGDTDTRYMDARAFCGGVLELVNGAERGNLEEAVDELNKVYSRFNVDFKVDDIKEQVNNERKSVWMPFIMETVAKELGIKEEGGGLNTNGISIIDDPNNEKGGERVQ